MISVMVRGKSVFVSQFQFELGLLIAVTLSSLVSLSRLYTGMHSVLVSHSFPTCTTPMHTLYVLHYETVGANARFIIDVCV